MCDAGPRLAFPGRNGGFRVPAGPRLAFPGRNGGVRVLGLDLYILFLNFVVMKKICLLCLALALAFSAAYAQQGLSFAGIPIAGTAGEFSDALAGAGFELCGENDSGVLLKGPFCGINCTVLVKYRPEDKSVRGVDAMCPIRRFSQQRSGAFPYFSVKVGSYHGSIYMSMDFEAISNPDFLSYHIG